MTASTDGGAVELRGIEKSFGAVRALAGIDLRIGSGELCGLIGPNGSGKSTLFDCCTGLTRPDAGSVALDGVDITRWAPYRIALAGRLRRSLQRNVVLGSMTVEENLLVAGQMHALPHMAATFLHTAANRRAMDELRLHAGELLDLVDLRPLQHTPAAELSVGQQKLLQFAATLMSSPRVVMLDEPFAGVNPILIERLVASIRWANTQHHATIVVIEHNIEELFNLCPRVVVMNAGELIADGTPEAVASDERVVEAYLGV
jgi:ABC-type branched-subunit amino acid transport system ATPase component